MTRASDVINITATSLILKIHVINLGYQPWLKRLFGKVIGEMKKLSSSFVRKHVVPPIIYISPPFGTF